MSVIRPWLLSRSPRTPLLTCPRGADLFTGLGQPWLVELLQGKWREGAGSWQLHGTSAP